MKKRSLIAASLSLASLCSLLPIQGACNIRNKRAFSQTRCRANGNEPGSVRHIFT